MLKTPKHVQIEPQRVFAAMEEIYFNTVRKPWGKTMFELGVPINTSLLNKSKTKYQGPLGLSELEITVLTRLERILAGDTALPEGPLKNAIEVSNSPTLLHRRETALYNSLVLGDQLESLENAARITSNAKKLEGLLSHYCTSVLLSWAANTLKFFDIWQEKYVHLAVPFNQGPGKRNSPFYDTIREHSEIAQLALTSPFKEDAFFSKIGIDAEEAFSFLGPYREGLFQAWTQARDLNPGRTFPVTLKLDPLPIDLIEKGIELLGRAPKNLYDHLQVRGFAGWAKRLLNFYEGPYQATLGKLGCGLKTGIFLGHHGEYLGKRGKNEAKFLMNDAFKGGGPDRDILVQLGTAGALDAVAEVYPKFREALQASRELPLTHIKLLLHDPQDYVLGGRSYFDRVVRNIREMPRFPAAAHVLHQNQFTSFMLRYVHQLTKMYDELSPEQRTMGINSLINSKDPAISQYARRSWRNLYSSTWRSGGFLGKQDVGFKDTMAALIGYRDDIAATYGHPK